MNMPIGSPGNLFNPGMPSFAAANPTGMAAPNLNTSGGFFNGASAPGFVAPSPNMNQFVNLATQLRALIGPGAQAWQPSALAAAPPVAAAPAAAPTPAAAPQTAIPGLGAPAVPPAPTLAAATATPKGAIPTTALGPGVAQAMGWTPMQNNPAFSTTTPLAQANALWAAQMNMRNSGGG